MLLLAALAALTVGEFCPSTPLPSAPSPPLPRAPPSASRRVAHPSPRRPPPPAGQQHLRPRPARVLRHLRRPADRQLALRRLPLLVCGRGRPPRLLLRGGDVHVPRRPRVPLVQRARLVLPRPRDEPEQLRRVRCRRESPSLSLSPRLLHHLRRLSSTGARAAARRPRTTVLGWQGVAPQRWETYVNERLRAPRACRSATRSCTAPALAR
jgi:hypothetical protein